MVEGGLLGLGLIELLFVFVGTWYFLRCYAHPNVGLPYYLTVFVAYFLGIGGTILLPIDIAFTDGEVHHHDGTTENGDDTVSPSISTADELGTTSPLTTVWLIVYWVTWVIAWLGVPLLQEFWAAGEFTFKARLKASLRANCRSIAVGALVVVVVLIWVATQSENPMAVLMAVSNFYALILIVLLMSYGMVDVPRSFWKASSPEKELRVMEFRAADVDMRLYESEEALKLVLEKVAKVAATLKNDHHPELQRFWGIVMEKVDLKSTLNKPGATPAWNSDDPHETKVTKLAHLHYELRQANCRVRRAQAEWALVLEKAEELENVINKVSAPYSTNAATALGTSTVYVALQSFRWKWKVQYEPGFNKVMTVVTAVMSVLLLWSEVTIPFGGEVSIFGALLRASAGSTVLSQVVALVPLAYASVCTYSSLVKLKIPFIDAYTMYNHGQTDAYALLFNAGYLSRLQFGLGANYLMMLQYAGDATSMWPSAFKEFIGEMNVDLLGSSFSYVFPISMLVVVVLLYFRIYDRFLMLIGVDLYVGMGEPISRGPAYTEKLREGQLLIRNGRRRKAKNGSSSSSAGKSSRDAPLSGGSARAKPLAQASPAGAGVGRAESKRSSSRWGSSKSDKYLRLGV